MPDTVFALATPPGEGGVAVIRISGPKVPSILAGCFPKKKKIEPRRVYVGRAREADGSVIDETLFFYMAAPASYTREDLAEIQCHGGTVCAQRIMRRVEELGARVALPGEFTRRAFENGRIRLDQAESVMALIAAGSRAAARAALRQMENNSPVKRAREKLTDLLGGISAAADYPDEVEEEEVMGDLEAGLEEICAILRRAADERAARAAAEGACVALSGCPNVGKSSLMNAILGCERAIVDAEAGTTRDVLSERVSVDGRLFTLMDTAGQRKEAGRVEMAGIERALEAEKNADCVVAVLDPTRPLSREDEAILNRRDERFILVENKCDLPAARPLTSDALRVSAKTGEGVEALTRRILKATDVSGMEEALSAPRQRKLAAEALSLAERALSDLRAGYPVDPVSVPLWEAARLLGEITGEEATEQVIDNVFARFCVGK